MYCMLQMEFQSNAFYVRIRGVKAVKMAIKLHYIKNGGRGVEGGKIRFSS